MAATAGFRAFISYSHADREVARWLQRAIETYRVPRALVAGGLPAKLYPVFRDSTDLRAGTDLKAAIRDALLASEALIVVCSPGAAASPYVDLEIRTFASAYPTRPILAVIADGDPAVGTPRCCFPQALTERGHEPGAADLRPGRDSRRSVRLKTVAGLLGVDVVALAQRDHHRRMLRLRWLVLAALVLAAAMGTLWVRAERARREAELQRAAAERSVEFMVGDLRTKLEPLGKLSILDAVATQAFDYYQRQRHTDLSPDSEARRARVLRMLGEIRSQEGDLDAALANYRAAATSTAALLAANPDDPQRIFDHAQSVFYIGDLARQQHRPDTAEAAFREYRRLSVQLVHIDPAKIEWQLELGYSATNLGAVLLDRGNNQAAEAQFRGALATFLAVTKAKPNDLEPKLELAQARAWLADPLTRRGRYADALAQLTEERRLYERLLSKSPDDKQVAARLLDVDIAQVGIEVARRDLKAAEIMSSTAVKTAQALLNGDPPNHEWANLLAGALLARAKILPFEEGSVAQRLEKLARLSAEMPVRALSQPAVRSEAAQIDLIEAILRASQHDCTAAIAAARRAEASASLASVRLLWKSNVLRNRAREVIARCFLEDGQSALAGGVAQQMISDLRRRYEDDVELRRLKDFASSVLVGRAA